MKRLSCCHSLLAAILLLAASAAHADWQFTKWGMTPEQVIAAGKKAGNNTITFIPQDLKKEATLDPRLEPILSGDHIIGKDKVLVVFYFDARNRGLAIVTFGFEHPKSPSLLLKNLKSRYGEPSQTTDDALMWVDMDGRNIVLYSTTLAGPYYSASVSYIDLERHKIKKKPNQNRPRGF